MSGDGSAPPTGRPLTPEQWADFVTKLRFARAIQVSAAKAASLPEDLHADFAAAWLALKAVLELVADQPDITADKLAGPLVQLSFALGDVQEGRSPPILTPHKRKGTKTTKGAVPTARLALMAMAAIAMDALIATSIGRQDAARQVARTLEASRIPIGGRLGATPAATVAGWRDTLNVGKHAPAPSLRIWRAYKQHPERYGATAEERAGKCLRELRENEAFRYI
jgi:hypothetical protein